MIAPPGWSEPFQIPEFDEFTYIIKGEKQFNIYGEVIILGAGQSIKIDRHTRIQYSNPFEEECEYLAICIPDFFFRSGIGKKLKNALKFSQTSLKPYLK